ncbi:MAG: hypothetical protein FWD71_11725 [Oscillospiraceae bacterium]|nr:hypothetical protein [Oscillospiraceae bacterium]
MSKKIFNIIIVLLSAAVLLLLIAALLMFLKSNTGSSNSGNDVIDNVTETSAEPTTEAPVTPDYPEYVLQQGPLQDPADFRGTDWVVIGKDGYLYENGYINEYLGTAPKYVNVTDDQLQSRVDKLKYIQDTLFNRGVAFCVVITPSKGANLSQFIPDYYKADHITPVGYVRPYIRFKQFLTDKGVYFVDSETVLKSVGLTNTFPKTGTHWNKLSSYEVTREIVSEYERQTGIQVQHLASHGIISSKTPCPFNANEQDIFGILMQSNRQDMKDAIVDDEYYWQDAYLTDTTNPKIGHMIIQGGSFTGDLNYYFGNLQLASGVQSYYYNNGGNVNINWQHQLRSSKFVLLEVNEQFIYNMGGDAPAWAENDINILPLGNNIVDSLYDYLVANPST